VATCHLGGGRAELGLLRLRESLHSRVEIRDWMDTRDNDAYNDFRPQTLVAEPEPNKLRPRAEALKSGSRHRLQCSTESMLELSRCFSGPRAALELCVCRICSGLALNPQPIAVWHPFPDPPRRINFRRSAGQSRGNCESVAT
jgi:hypothetical protein